MSPENIQCVRLADGHDGPTEGVGALESVVDVAVLVADETSLFNSAGRLRPKLAAVACPWRGEEGPG